MHPVEWVDSDDGSRPESEDILDIGSRRRTWLTGFRKAPRRRGGWVLGLALLIGIALLATNHASAPPSQNTPVRQQDVARISLPTVRSLATSPGPLLSYVRQTSAAGACARVAVGSSPALEITGVIHRAFPGFVVQDSGRTLDQFTGLCSIEVRAENRADAVLVITVASPAVHTHRAQYTQVETGIETQHGVTTKYAVAVTSKGWTVLVGATGHSGLPGANDLVRVSQEPALLW